MKTAVAILTYNRLNALKVCLESFHRHLRVGRCCEMAIFEDGGYQDDTEGYLRSGKPIPTLFEATRYTLTRSCDGKGRLIEAFLGTHNLGVAGNSNRAIRWFLEETNADVLLLCNDDIEAHGDFAAFYARAHEALGVGLFCFCDLPGEEYQPVRVPMGPYEVKLFSRMTGIMMSMTRKLVETIGYFDPRMGRFGEEHCVAGDTPLITRNRGLVRIQDVQGERVEVWNGNQWSEVCPRLTGSRKSLVRVRFGDGSFLDCTPDHRFSVFTYKSGRRSPLHEVLAKNLTRWHRCEATTVDANFGSPYTEHDPYTLGAMVGDGFISDQNKRTLRVNLAGKKRRCPIQGLRGTDDGRLQPVYTTNEVDFDLFVRLRKPEGLRCLFQWDRPSLLQFIAGLFDMDGTEIRTGAVSLSLSYEQRARDMQLLLTRCGIKSSICLSAAKGTLTNLGPRKEDLWLVGICDGRELPCHRIDVSRGHCAFRKGKYQTVRSIEELDGAHNTYCFDEPFEHKGLFANVLTFQCEYTNRARMAGFLNLEGQPQQCLDVEQSLLSSQKVESTMPPEARQRLQEAASARLLELTRSYLHDGLYRPYALRDTPFAGGTETAGLRTSYLRAGYAPVRS